MLRFYQTSHAIACVLSLDHTNTSIVYIPYLSWPFAIDHLADSYRSLALHFGKLAYCLSDEREDREGGTVLKYTRSSGVCTIIYASGGDLIYTS